MRCGIDWAEVVGGNPSGSEGALRLPDNSDQGTLPTGHVSASNRGSAALFAEKLSFSGDASPEPSGFAADGEAAGLGGDKPVKHSFTANRQAKPARDLGELYILGNPPFIERINAASNKPPIWNFAAPK